MKTENKTKRRKKPVFKAINEHIDRINRESFCGSINLKIDPIAFQRKIRDEWR